MAIPLSGSPIVLATYFTGAADATEDQRDAVIAEATRRVFRALGRD
jgi:beta-lactamase class A